jgi:hypothetical protein
VARSHQTCGGVQSDWGGKKKEEEEKKQKQPFRGVELDTLELS